MFLSNRIHNINPKRYFGGIGFPTSYFAIANMELTPSLIRKIREPKIIFFVVAGDASGKTTLIENLKKKYAHEFDIDYMCNAPNNPLELNDDIMANRFTFIDIHEINNELYNWINNLKTMFRDDFVFILVHPHITMETYRKRITERLINNSLELRFEITPKLFRSDIIRHVNCSNYMFTLKNEIIWRNIMDLIIIYDNNDHNKKVINISSKNNNKIYEPKLLQDVYDKGKMDVSNETNKTFSYYKYHSPYCSNFSSHDLIIELDYERLVKLKNNVVKDVYPFFPSELNRLFNSICNNYLDILNSNKKIERLFDNLFNI